MAEFQEKLIATAARGLTEVADEFADELERRPSSAELFEVVAQALKSFGDERLSDVSPSNVAALKPQIKRGAKRLDSRQEADGPEASSVSDLNDAAFVVAGDLVADLADGFKRETGLPPTLNELCGLLVAAAQRCDAGLLADINPADIAGLKAEVNKRRKIKAEVGDIVAIPLENGEYAIAVILAKNTFGVAYGFFQGASKIPRPFSVNSHPPAAPHPVYSTDALVANGRWKIVGHDEALLSLFPSEPEIYLRQQVIPGMPDYGKNIGPYGSGQTASGRTRDLTKEEAEELGLLDGTYRQTFVAQYLEDHLSAQQKRREKK
jgi:alkylhydroperoxidase/carboxymuconolactone decarboxylase family protein YurZ